MPGVPYAGQLPAGWAIVAQNPGTGRMTARSPQGLMYTFTLGSKPPWESGRPGVANSQARGSYGNSARGTQRDPYDAVRAPAPTKRTYRPGAGMALPAGYRQAVDPRVQYPTDSQQMAAPQRTAAQAQAILDQEGGYGRIGQYSAPTPRRAAKGVAVKGNMGGKMPPKPMKGEHKMPDGHMMKDAEMKKMMGKKKMPMMNTGGAVKGHMMPDHAKEMGKGKKMGAMPKKPMAMGYGGTVKPVGNKGKKK